MIESINELDKVLLPFFNGGNSMFMDHFVVLLTNGLTWIPLYIALIILIIKNNEKFSQVLLLFGMVAFALALSYGIGGLIIKPYVARLRPVVDPSMSGLINVVNGYVPSGYSFFSSHSANTFALAVFLSLIVRNGVFSAFMLLWAALNAWTRLYLAVHYPSDVAIGTVWGIIDGFIAFFIYRHFYFKISPHFHYISNQYTSSGYDKIDIDFVLNIFVLTIIVMAIVSCFQMM